LERRKKGKQVRGASLKFSGQRQSSRRRATPRAATQQHEIAVYDGRTYRGRVVMLRGGGFQAIDATGRILGIFQAAGEAYAACEGAPR
jgi:hypothetical protein